MFSSWNVNLQKKKKDYKTLPEIFLVLSFQAFWRQATVKNTVYLHIYTHKSMYTYSKSVMR